MLSVVDAGARTQDDILTAPPMPMPHGRTFGGQVLGQAIAAAATTVAAGREIHSMHGYFLRPGDADERLTFEVSRLHDGRSFSTRRTQAFQGGENLMSMIASYQDESEGLEHQDPIDLSEVPAPESIPSMPEKYGHLAADGYASWMLSRPFDFRYVESDIILRVSERTNHQRVWIRSIDTLPNEQWLHAAALAFVSDYLLVEPIARQHGIPWSSTGVSVASLDHAMWFHRPFRADEWLLYELESPIAHGARGLTHGKFFNTHGELVASVSQECMVRVPQTSSDAQ